MRAVVFDLDDTLISERVYIRSGFRAVAKHLEEMEILPDIWEDIYPKLLRLFDEDSKNVFNRLLDSYHITYEPEDVKELVTVYREHKPTIVFHEDVLSTLQKLREQGKKLGIVSDGYVVTQKNKLEAVNAAPLFDEIILTDELGREFWKPSTKAFEILAEKWKLPYEEMLYVGDNPEKDFIISKSIPIKTARIYREDAVYLNHLYKDGWKEDYPLKNLGEVVSI